MSKDTYSVVEKDTNGNLRYKVYDRGTLRQDSEYVDTPLTEEVMVSEFWMMFDWARIKETFTKVVVPIKFMDELRQEFIPRWKAYKKKNEYLYRSDGKNMEARAETGFPAELAVGMYFGVDILERDEYGRLRVDESTLFGADFSKYGLKLGVKSYRAPNFPVASPITKNSQLIVARTEYNEFFVGGLYSVSAMNNPEYQSSCYIKDLDLRNKRDRKGRIAKKAFIGLMDYTICKTFDDVIKACK